MIIEKFGGSSMADPQLVLERIEEQEQQSTIAVVSAPGIDNENPIKLTDLLLGYKTQPTASRKEAVLQRVQSYAARADINSSDEFILNAEEEMEVFAANNWPVEALGELWSARAFSYLSRRQFLDPARVVKFDENGILDTTESFGAFQDLVEPGQQYVMPGFFGSLPDKNIHVFERGGSDISGALAALALEASCYRNWSDVAGFMSADPRQSDNTRMLQALTYREVREFAVNGCELLHKDVATLLEDSSVQTVMCDTNTGKHGTVINSKRIWATDPVVGVTGKIIESDDIGALHIVGEGIAECRTVRSRTINTVLAALANAGVEVIHIGDNLLKAGITLHVPSVKFDLSRQIVHENVFT